MTTGVIAFPITFIITDLLNEYYGKSGIRFVTFIVLFIAFYGPMTLQTIIAVTLFNYGYKFIVAIIITPVIYGAHWLIDRYLRDELRQELVTPTGTCVNQP